MNATVQLSPAARADAERILAKAARRLLAEQIAAEESKKDEAGEERS